MTSASKARNAKYYAVGCEACGARTVTVFTAPAFCPACGQRVAVPEAGVHVGWAVEAKGANGKRKKLGRVWAIDCVSCVVTVGP